MGFVDVVTVSLTAAVVTLGMARPLSVNTVPPLTGPMEGETPSKSVKYDWMTSVQRRKSSPLGDTSTRIVITGVGPSPAHAHVQSQDTMKRKRAAKCQHLLQYSRSNRQTRGSLAGCSSRWQSMCSSQHCLLSHSLRHPPPCPHQMLHPPETITRTHASDMRRVTEKCTDRGERGQLLFSVATFIPRRHRRRRAGRQETQD